MRERILPTVVSHGWNRVFRPSASRFQAMFDWAGTGDPSAWLVVPDAIRTVASLVPGGWPEVMARNHELALAARDLLCDALAVTPPAPDGMIGAMAALPLPDAPPRDGMTKSDWGDEDVLGDRLRLWGIEVPIVPWPRSPNRLVRVSAQLYNRIEDYERLARGLVAELADSSAVLPGSRSR
jgi:isopenicillin-N epimerase